MVTTPTVPNVAPRALRFGLLALLVAAVTVIAFQPAFDGQWLKWDDDRNFLDNEAWRGLSARNVAWMFTTFHQGPYQPLSWLTLGAEYELWGMDPRGYHVTNVVLQALTAVAFFAFARALFERVAALRAAMGWKLDVAAALAALFFAVHPLRVESVAWLTERRDVLSGLFFALTGFAYVRFAAAEGRARTTWFVAAHVLFALSLASKGLGFPLPVALLVLDAFVLGRWSGAWTGPDAGGKRSLVGLAREKLGLIVLALVAAYLAWKGQSTHASMRDLEAYGLGSRVVGSFHGLWFYAWKTLVPLDLIPLVPLPARASPTEARFAVAIVAVCAAAAVAWLLRRRVPALGAALFAYAILVAPVLGLTQAGPQLVADRYSYLPSTAFALLFGGALAYVAVARPSVARWSFALGAVLVLALVPLTRAQSAVWHDDVTLWAKTVTVRPDDAPAYRNLVMAYLRPAEAATDPAVARPLFERAIVECRRGLEAGPDAGLLSNASSAFRSLAWIDLEHTQQYLETALDYAKQAVARSAVEKEPTKVAYLNLGFTYLDLERPAEAVAPFAWYADHYPEDPEAAFRLAQTLSLAGRTREALVALEAALKIAPYSPRVWMEKGLAHRALGEKPEAIACIERALKLAELVPTESAEHPDVLASWREVLATLKSP